MPKRKIDYSARDEYTGRWPHEKHWELNIDGIDLSGFVGPRPGDIDEEAYLKLDRKGHKNHYDK